MSQKSFILFILRNEVAERLTPDCSGVSHETVEQGCGASGGIATASEGTASRTIRRIEYPKWEETHKDLKSSSRTGKAAQLKLGWE